MAKPSKELLGQIKSVTNKRARFVLETIARNGVVTTEEIKAAGYDHPPRAARDVRELGFNLITTSVRSSSGRHIAAYTLAAGEKHLEKFERQNIPKKERDRIIENAGRRCHICSSTHNLQVDHRVPYEVAGETEAGTTNAFQVLCGSCNRTKSWECEHCANSLTLKDVELCRTCYWANSEAYEHVALRAQRRVDLVWNENDFKDFDLLQKEADDCGKSIKELIKEKAHQGLNQPNNSGCTLKSATEM